MPQNNLIIKNKSASIKYSSNSSKNRSIIACFVSYEEILDFMINDIYINILHKTLYKQTVHSTKHRPTKHRHNSLNDNHYLYKSLSKLKTVKIITWLILLTLMTK
jgi:hypothetical protein